jgi:trehalose 6-phosphate phosphatase
MGVDLPMAEPPPLPGNAERWALFLDVDGTLVAIAPTPEAARPAPDLLPLLERLQKRCDGALAVVSGRRLDSIDEVLEPLPLPAAGLHGWERRRADGSLAPRLEPMALLDRLRPMLGAYVTPRHGLRLEDKGGSLAVHYRLAPQYGPPLLRYARRIARAEPELRVIAGRKVVEVQPRGADKGQAVRAFMTEPPFAGRRPVYAGDDTTDEDGFAAVNAMDGISIRVAAAETRARGDSLAHHVLPSVEALHRWLRAVAECLAPLDHEAHSGTSAFHRVLR